ncbi:hypothetical protein ABT369_25775 [Dactylosporangium sp. NPDC000244]|uniref:hypothetical protein n=1 Tax=Dactylosporangium sp. NPDC000244 TaxID=3154365 RepID=UPI00332F2EC9
MVSRYIRGSGRFLQRLPALLGRAGWLAGLGGVLGLALLVGSLAGTPFGAAGTGPEPLRPSSGLLAEAEIAAIRDAAASCPTLSPPRLAGQLAATRTVNPSPEASSGTRRALHRLGIDTATWNRWAPWPMAEPTDPAAGVKAVAHHTCDLVGELRAGGVTGGVTGDLWRAAVAAERVGADAVRKAGGVPASAQSYVNTVDGYARWYESNGAYDPAPSATASAARPTTSTNASPSATKPATPRRTTTGAGTSPPAPATSGPVPTFSAPKTVCIDQIKIGDVGIKVCVTWGYLNGGFAYWKPTRFDVTTSDSSKPVYVVINTSAENEPDRQNLGRVDGAKSWTVPASYDWTMTSGVESTTTEVSRTLPGRTTPCTAMVRHQPTKIFVMTVSGSC